MKPFIDRNRQDPRCLDLGIVWGPRHWSESDHYLVITGRPWALLPLAAAFVALAIFDLVVWWP